MKTLIQASTLNALMLGNFDETVSVKDYLHHADTGIGTCAGLDGEAGGRRSLRHGGQVR